VSADGEVAATQRLFVALPVPEHVRVLAQAAAAPARDAHPELTWTRPEGWHLTLAFLGDVEVARVGEVARVVGEAVTAARLAPPSCRLAGAGRFAGRALYLAVEDAPSGSVATLGEVVQGALADAGLAVRRRPVRPHLTLARASRRGASVDDEVVALVAPVAARWEAGEVELVRSELGDGPAHYVAVASWSLGSSG
jgi:RNA 2',3'-cyclic 3'-phosphodiesterase